MSRTSGDQYDSEGALKNGFDYGRQCWVLDYLIQDCGHPAGSACGCFGRDHKGENIALQVRQ